MSHKINYSYLHLFQNISSDFFLLCNVQLGRVTARVFWHFSSFLPLFHQFPVNAEARMCSQSLLMRIYYFRSESSQWLCISQSTTQNSQSVFRAFKIQTFFLHSSVYVCVYIYTHTHICIYTYTYITFWCSPKHQNVIFTIIWTLFIYILFLLNSQSLEHRLEQTGS